MGEYSYAQPDFQEGYGDFSGYGEPTPGGYQAEVQALIPQDVPLLGAVLLEKGVLSDATLNAALARQAETGDSLAQVLLEGGWAAPDQLVEALQIRAAYG